MAEAVAEPVVLDHLCGHAHHGQRVRMVGAVVAGHVEHTHHLAGVVEDRRGRAGQEMVGADEVFVAVHERGGFVEQRGAHGIGALGRLGPVHAGGQRNLLRLFHEAVVADAVQDGAL